MKKTQIIILAVAGLLSFAGTFTVTWFLRQAGAAPPTGGSAQTAPGPAGSGANSAQPPIGESLLRAEMQDAQAGPALSMSEKQLQSLIYDVREKMKEYKFKERDLAEQSKQIALAREALQEDIDRLTALNAQLAVTYDQLRKQEENLQKSRVEITKLEQENMKRLALTYDKMDSAQASAVIVDMMTGQQLSDAVKIVYYMNERMAGKLLGEIATDKPDLAALLSLELKKVRESE